MGFNFMYFNFLVCEMLTSILFDTEKEFNGLLKDKETLG